MLRAISFLVVTYLAFVPLLHQQPNQQTAGPSSSVVKDVPPVRSDDERSRKISECNTPDRPKPEVQAKMDLGLCGKAISLPKPAYPDEAKKQKVSGLVTIEIVIDEEGDPIWAKAIDGPPLLHEASLKAACLSRHSPTKISGQAVKVHRVITYNFSSK